MRTYTPRELRLAVTIAVVLTAVVMFALLDPSCRPRRDVPHAGPSRSLAPN